MCTFCVLKNGPLLNVCSNEGNDVLVIYPCEYSFIVRTLCRISQGARFSSREAASCSDHEFEQTGVQRSYSEFSSFLLVEDFCPAAHMRKHRRSAALLPKISNTEISHDDEVMYI